jgi:hypothetical protein
MSNILLFPVLGITDSTSRVLSPVSRESRVAASS